MSFRGARSASPEAIFTIADAILEALEHSIETGVMDSGLLAALGPGMTRLNLLQRQRHALPDADAHRRQRALAAALFQPVHRGQRQPRAGHAERVAERDSAAVRIDVVGVVGDAELAQAGQALRGERFVDLD